MAETERFWRGWVDGGRFPDHPWREHLQRSALTLKGLTYAPTGALLAAPTTSLPEHPGGRRNWDYRYTWVRDAAFTLWALHALGFDAEADDFLAFLADAIEPEGFDEGQPPAEQLLQVLYGVDGTRALPETEIDHLSGYGGSQAGPHWQCRLQPRAVRHPRSHRRLRLPTNPLAGHADRAGMDDRRAGRGDGDSFLA